MSTNPSDAMEGINKFFNTIKNFIERIKQSPWTPSFSEFIIFSTIVVIFIIFIVLFHYNAVQKQVRLTSRCYKDRNMGRVGGIYMVNATNARNEPLYNVSYDLNAKSYNVQCACPEGNTVNKFDDIKVYNLQTRTEQKLPEKYCQCNGLLYDASAGDKVYYNGYPGLTRFMYNNDTSFFTNFQNSS